MNNKLNLPAKIHVGLQERSGTYTGKLAYVIYTDEKGKKRKEHSWDGWRDHKIEPLDFDNIPTEGFVLNKGVGGARESYGWNARNEYIRVYDPRGFEFEISIANLLFILTHCDAFKGKGLEGEFVYSWSGADLLLLPVECKEYSAAIEYTAGKSKKVTKKDMVASHEYITKSQEKVVYIGRLLTYNGNSNGYYSPENSLNTLVNHDKKMCHVFYEPETCQYTTKVGFTHLAESLDTSYPEYAKVYNKYVTGPSMSPLKEIRLVPINTDILVTRENDACVIHNKAMFIIKTDKGYVIISFDYWGYGCGYSNNLRYINDSNIINPVFLNNLKYSNRSSMTGKYFFTHFKDYELFTIEIILESNVKLTGYNYVKPK